MGDIYDAAFKIIRINPKATVGSSVVVTAFAMLIPVVITGIMTLVSGVSLDFASAGTPESTAAQNIVLALSYAGQGLGYLLQWVGTIFVTGIIIHVTAAAATGRPMGLGEAWAATRGKRWRLLGLAVLFLVAGVIAIVAYALLVVVAAVAIDALAAVAVGLLLGVVLVAGLVWAYVRLTYFAAAAFMLEDVGAFGAIDRSVVLTRSQFWRTFGIALLSAIIAQLASSVIAMPIAMVSVGLWIGDPFGAGFFFYILGGSLAAVVSAAFVTPWVTTVACLQYLDQRIRKEAYDVELLAASGMTSTEPIAR